MFLETQLIQNYHDVQCPDYERQFFCMFFVVYYCTLHHYPANKGPAHLNCLTSRGSHFPGLWSTISVSPSRERNLCTWTIGAACLQCAGNRSNSMGNVNHEDRPVLDWQWLLSSVIYVTSLSTRKKLFFHESTFSH